MAKIVVWILLTLRCWSQVTGIKTTPDENNSVQQEPWPQFINSECDRDKNEEHCYDDEKYDDICDSKGGTRVGSRCFFRDYTPSSWVDGWAACIRLGGVLAQLHTASEFIGVRKLLDRDMLSEKAYLPSYRVALLRLDRSPVSDGHSLVLSDSYWCESVFVCPGRLRAAETYIRRYEKDDPYNHNSNCFIFFDRDKINDTRCIDKEMPLCMLINKAQKFMQIPGTCLFEEPIDEFQNVSVQACANECSLQGYCHSFNYYSDRSCRLFSFSIKDQTETKDNLNWCSHYTVTSQQADSYTSMTDSRLKNGDYDDNTFDRDEQTSQNFLMSLATESSETIDDDWLTRSAESKDDSVALEVTSIDPSKDARANSAPTMLIACSSWSILYLLLLFLIDS